MAKGVTRRSRGYSDRRVIHPKREWFIGIGIFVLITAIGAFWNIEEYMYYNTIESRAVGESVKPRAYQGEKVEEALQLFTQKQETFDALTNSAPRIIETLTPTASSSDEVATTTPEVELESEADDDADQDVVIELPEPEVIPEEIPAPAES